MKDYLIFMKQQKRNNWKSTSIDDRMILSSAVGEIFDWSLSRQFCSCRFAVRLKVPPTKVIIIHSERRTTPDHYETFDTCDMTVLWSSHHSAIDHHHASRPISFLFFFSFFAGAAALLLLLITALPAAAGSTIVSKK